MILVVIIMLLTVAMIVVYVENARRFRAGKKLLAEDKVTSFLRRFIRR